MGSAVDISRRRTWTAWLRRFTGVLRPRQCHGNGLRSLERCLGYSFANIDLLRTALTHPSMRGNGGNGDCDNQRLEFLGDAVLGFMVAADLYRRHQDHREGLLTCLRSRVTNGRMLGRIARDIGLGDYIVMARGEERMGGRKRSSVLADALESVFGAAYIDGGMRATERIFQQLISPALGNANHDVWAENPKGKLQCLTQRIMRQDPCYRVRAQEGSRHEPVFVIEVAVQDEVIGHGRGANKRQAQFAAARMALKTLSQRQDAASGETAFDV